jgi:hypothetical protein
MVPLLPGDFDEYSGHRIGPLDAVTNVQLTTSGKLGTGGRRQKSITVREAPITRPTAVEDLAGSRLIMVNEC